jgi:hypothetical protein
MRNIETFKKTIFGGGAISSDGYRVYFNSPTHIEYVGDDGTKVFVGAEGLAQKQAMAIYPNEMRIGSPNGSLITDSALRDRVLERVRRVGAFLGWTLE